MFAQKQTRFGRLHLTTMLSAASVVIFGVLTIRAADAPKNKITHAFLATGGETYIVDGDGKITWQYPHSSRDGCVLPNGNVLLALSQSKKYPGGAGVEVTRDNKVVFEFKGTQSEVNTVQAVEKDHFMITEAGAKPRLLEVDREGKIVIEIPLQAQAKDHHLQTRMAQTRQRQLSRSPVTRQSSARILAAGQGRLGSEDAEYALHGDTIGQRQHSHRLYARPSRHRSGQGRQDRVASDKR